MLRDEGVVALASSDWSRARLDPFTDDVQQALRVHYLLRHHASGDPFMGRALPDLVLDTGYVAVQVQRADRVDMAYDQLARYVGTRATAAVRDAEGENRDLLQRTADAASRWALRERTFTQCWVEITARWPGEAPPSLPPAPDARDRHPRRQPDHTPEQSRR